MAEGTGVFSRRKGVTAFLAAAVGAALWLGGPSSGPEGSPSRRLVESWSERLAAGGVEPAAEGVAGFLLRGEHGFASSESDPGLRREAAAAFAAWARTRREDAAHVAWAVMDNAALVPRRRLADRMRERGWGRDAPPGKGRAAGRAPGNWLGDFLQDLAEESRRLLKEAQDDEKREDSLWRQLGVC